MLKAGKMQEIADLIVGSQIQLVALKEVRRKGYSVIKKEKYSIYYSRNPNTIGHAGNRIYNTKISNEYSNGFRTNFRLYV
jgi:hypothetical protein